MTPSPLLSSLWSELRSDFNSPGMLWQVGTLAFCLAAGWVLARALRGRLTVNEARLRIMRFGVESFSRVLSPLIALGLMVIARPILAQWHHVSLLQVAIPLVASFALIRTAFYVLRRGFARGGSVGRFVLLFEKVFATLVWLGVALYITGLWPELMLYMERSVVPVGRHKVSLMTTFQAAASVVVTVLLALWAGTILEERLMQADTMHSSLRAVMARLGRALLILVAVLVSLSLVGIDLTVLSVFGGALGVGLGLGLQKIASSYVSGFVILLERSLAIGDMVTVDKFYGRVTQINTRYTTLRGLDGVESMVPNEMLVAGPVRNHSLSDRMLRLAAQVTVSYQTDIDAVLALLEQAAAGVARVADAPSPQALLLKFGADGLELEVEFWIEDSENGTLNVMSEVNRAIWSRLQAHQITVPYPQREVRLSGRHDGEAEPALKKT